MVKSKITSRSEAASTRSLGGKRCSRFSISTDNETEKMLNALATSCSMSKSEMVDVIIRSALRSVTYVQEIQERYNVEKRYWINPIIIKKNGKETITY
jgi:malate/lactate dehydrogenase